MSVLKEQVKPLRGRKVYILSDNVEITIPNAGTKIFPKRAILRIAMLLRDSPIAREIRTQLLNTFEHSTDLQKITEISNEEALIKNIGLAYMNGTKEELFLSLKDYSDYQNRHISELTKENNNLKPQAEAYNRLINNKGWYKAESVAKAFGVSRNKLYDFLRENNVMTKQSGHNLPYQKYINDGFFSVKFGRNGDYNFSYTVFSPKGIDFINKLAARGGLVNECV